MAPQAVLWFVAGALQDTEQVFTSMFLWKGFTKQGHALSGIPSGYAAGMRACWEHKLSMQDRDLSLLWCQRHHRQACHPSHSASRLCQSTGRWEDTSAPRLFLTGCWSSMAAATGIRSPGHGSSRPAGFSEHSSYAATSPSLCMVAVCISIPASPAFPLCRV